ncbi:MAG: hypothetical protein HC937_03100 [Aquincola sp.]|nr:hypothetical protein [Aquincola sp.]
MGRMIRFLRDGGMLGILTDQHMRTAERFTFFGKPARTATSAADLALKYDAEIIPIFAVRQPDGLSFRIVVDAPVVAQRPGGVEHVDLRRHERAQLVATGTMKLYLDGVEAATSDQLGLQPEPDLDGMRSGDSGRILLVDDGLRRTFINMANVREVLEEESERPVVIRKGSVYVTTGTDRRTSGTQVARV